MRRRSYVVTRHGKRWEIPETLKLQREYELLQLPIDEIAYKHLRNTEAIEARIMKEGFVQRSN